MRILIVFLILASAAAADPHFGARAVVQQQIAAASGGGGLTVTLVDGTGPFSGGASDLTLNATGATEGALLLFLVELRDVDSITSAPAGLTLIIRQDDGAAGTQPHIYAYSKVAAATETSYTFTFNGSTFPSGLLVEVTPGATVFDQLSDPGNTIPAMVIPEGGLSIIMAGKFQLSNTQPIGVPLGYTLVAERSGNKRAGCAIAYAAVGGTTTNGTDAWTPGSGDALNTIHIAIDD